MNNLDKACELIKTSEYTCVMCSDNDTYTSCRRGVAPLLECLDKNNNMCGYSAADKVVGNGAAYIYVLLQIKEVYAEIISRSAYDTLTDYGIPVCYSLIVDSIRNRSNTGVCPIETAVQGCHSPQEALAAIRQKLSERGQM